MSHETRRSRSRSRSRSRAWLVYLSHSARRVNARRAPASGVVLASVVSMYCVVWSVGFFSPKEKKFPKNSYFGSQISKSQMFSSRRVSQRAVFLPPCFWIRHVFRSCSLKYPVCAVFFCDVTKGAPPHPSSLALFFHAPPFPKACSLGSRKASVPAGGGCKQRAKCPVRGDPLASQRDNFTSVRHCAGMRHFDLVTIL